MANTHVVSFIQSLSAEETRIAADYLKKFHPLIHSSEHESKEYRLFEYIIANKDIQIDDNELSKTTDTKDLRHLKNNLYDKVIESLTLDKHITNKNLFAEQDIVSFTLRKKLLVCRISIRSLNQGKTDAVYELLNDIHKEAVEYELYDLLVEALNSKKYIKGIRMGSGEFEKMNAEAMFYDYCYKSVINAADSYYRLILNNELIKSLNSRELKKHIEKSIADMEQAYRKSKSQSVNYYLQIMKMALAEKNKDFQKCIDYCNKLLAVVKKNKAVYRRERMGFVFDNLCQYKMLTGEFEDAIKDARKAQEFYSEDNFNYIISKEQEFHACFYAKEYDKAMMCINSLMNHSLIDTGEFRKSKYIYYEACVLFMLGKFKEASQLLNKSLEIEKDKARGNIIIRILNIMLFIELNKLNEASSLIESLRKFIDRTSKDEEVNPRYILISKALRELEKNGFEYHADSTALQKLLKELSDKNTEAAWEYYTSGLIPFHQWLEQKRIS